ncbi:MAG: WXG100 family type VII secretion target [Jatrophihabitantaceae bacterium]
MTGSGFQSDAAAMTRAVQAFEDSSTQARKAMSDLDGTLAQATAHYQGAQAVAFQNLHTRIQEDMQVASKELATMSELVNSSFRNYSAADDTVASSLHSVANSAGGAGGSVLGRLSGS